ncbi:hypothetical protein HN358_04065 [Candidatus Uhrbacteria bacterium]|jgi:hypothetical protein|nr:hypothetical protein [Candidatus Uhrbacteria bacterium]MBT7716954.1 hypothetical protein [Candidatus Uhrbacteria bacterium]
MNSLEYWQWLNQFITLLEDQAEKIKQSPDPRTLAQMRIAEHTLNFEIDQFMHFIDTHEKMPVSVFLNEQNIGSDAWNEIKQRRDSLAGKLSEMIGSNPEFTEQYQYLCEELKNHNSI